MLFDHYALLLMNYGTSVGNWLDYIWQYIRLLGYPSNYLLFSCDFTNLCCLYMVRKCFVCHSWPCKYLQSKIGNYLVHYKMQ